MLCICYAIIAGFHVFYWGFEENITKNKKTRGDSFVSQNESGDYYVPSSPVIDNSDLKWKELMKEDVTPDYFVNNLASIVR